MHKNIDLKVSLFFSQFPAKSYKKGDILIEADGEPQGIFYLRKGTVKQFALSSEGEEQLITVYKPGTFFPMMWAINHVQNRYFFEARSNVEVNIGSKQKSIAFIKAEPDVMYDLLARMYKGVEGLMSRVENLLFNTARHKIIHAILNNTERFGKAKNHLINLKLTHKEIVSFTGLTKETVSREIKKLEQEGLIQNSRREFEIKDLLKLKNSLSQ